MNNNVHSTNFINLPLRTTRTICELRLNKRTRNKRSRTRRKIVQNRINTQNLRQKATSDQNFDEIVKNI